MELIKEDKASLMLDIKAFLDEFKSYSPANREQFDSRIAEFEKAYADLECAKKIITCVRIYVHKKYEERIILDNFYKKIEQDFFDEAVDYLSGSGNAPDPDSFRLPEGYSRFTAEALVPFILDKLR